MLFHRQSPASAPLPNILVLALLAILTGLSWRGTALVGALDEVATGSNHDAVKDAAPAVPDASGPDDEPSQHIEPGDGLYDSSRDTTNEPVTAEEELAQELDAPASPTALESPPTRKMPAASAEQAPAAGPKKRVYNLHAAHYHPDNHDWLVTHEMGYDHKTMYAIHGLWLDIGGKHEFSHFETDLHHKFRHLHRAHMNPYLWNFVKETCEDTWAQAKPDDYHVAATVLLADHRVKCFAGYHADDVRDWEDRGEDAVSFLPSVEALGDAPHAYWYTDKFDTAQHDILHDKSEL